MSRGPVPMHSQQPPGVVQNRSTLQCSKQNTEQCGYDHAPVTRGRMRAQFPLPHGPPPTGTGHREVLGMPLHRHRGAGLVCAGRGCLGPVRRWCRGRTSGRRAPCAARKAGPSRARHRVGPTTRTTPGPRRRENADIAGRAWGVEARAARRAAREARERASGGRPCA